MIPTVRCAGLVLLVAGSVGCARFQTKSVAPVVVLAMPTPPARELIPVELPEPEPEVPVAVEAPAPPPAPAPPRETPARPAPPAPAPAVTAPPETTPPAVIQTATQTSEIEQKIRATIAAADQALKSVNFRDLSNDARLQYDQAVRFIQQANDNLKARKYAFAALVADKAADIARLLAKG